MLVRYVHTAILIASGRERERERGSGREREREREREIHSYVLIHYNVCIQMALLYEIQYSDRESVHYYCQLHKTCVVWLLIFSFYIFRSIKSYYESRGSNAINSEYKKTVELAEQESSGSKCCGRWQQETAITWVLLNLTHLSFSLSYVATLWLLPRYSFSIKIILLCLCQ